MQTDKDLVAQDPKIGLEEGDDATATAFSEPGKSPRQAKKAGLGKFLLVALLLLMTSAAFLGLGFIAGQRYGQQLANKQQALSAQAQNSVCLQELTAGFSRLNQDLAKLQETTASLGASLANPMPPPPPPPPSLSEGHLQDIQLTTTKLVETVNANHEAFKAWGDIPDKVRKMETILSGLDAGKVSITQDLCPASERLPEKYTAKKPTH